GRLVVLVHLIAEARIADLVQAHELIEAVGTSVWEHKPTEGNSKPRFAERLDWLRFSQHARTSGNDDVLTVVRVHGVGDETIDRGGHTAVESVRQHGVNHGSLQDPVQG